SRFLVDRPQELEMVHDPARGHGEVLADQLVIRSVDTFSVFFVSIKMDTGSVTPIAYANWISHLSARPAATMFFAMYRAMYDAERSTLLGSLPENAPPPWLPTPPYVSTMILRPVSPVSPMGPPTTNRPVGLMWYLTLRGSKMSLGMTGLITCSITSRSIFLQATSGLCWVETTIVSTRTGRPFRYSTVTWDLPSGRIHGRRLFFRTSASRRVSRCASTMGIGINSGVSFDA